MTLDLSPEQYARIGLLFGDARGNYNTGRRSGCFKITSKQLIKIKKLHAVGRNVKDIKNTTKLSTYIVKRAIEGCYDSAFKQKRL